LLKKQPSAAKTLTRLGDPSLGPIKEGDYQHLSVDAYFAEL
jgi:hypothetical protein